MKITQSYKYKKNGITYVSGKLPEDAELVESLDILYSKVGYELVHKYSEKHIGTSLWLKEGDSQDNYEEVEIPEETDEQEKRED